MRTEIYVENIKCSGCVGSIEKGLLKIEHIEKVDIDIEKGLVKIEHQEGLDKEKLSQKLLSLGYPEVGTAEGFEKVKAGAKSFVSCAIGRMSK